MKIIAHRGFSAFYTENTLLAFEKAIEAGADAIETDIRLSKDKKIIIFHDDDLSRLTSSNQAPESMTLNELKNLELPHQQKIPSLDEMIILCQNKITLILEIKFNPKTYEDLIQELYTLIKDKLDWIEVSCFDDRPLKKLYEFDPSIKLHQLIDKPELLEQDLKKSYPFASCFDIDVNLYELALKLLPNHKVIFWTVHDHDLFKAKKNGLYGAMSNDPLALKEKYV